jgi:molybdate transport system substrate-binding protein
VGTIPAEVQPKTFFVGFLTSATRQPDVARELLRFLTSPEATPVIVKAGLMPPS